MTRKSESSTSSAAELKEQHKSNVEQLNTVSLKANLSKDDAQVEQESDKKFNEIVDFIQKKLEIGGGETLYQLGDNDNRLTEDELMKSIEMLDNVCQHLDADYYQLNNKTTENDKFYRTLFLIRKRIQIDDFREVRIAVLGNVDSGKSTLLSVLTHGQLDDGRGLARQKLFRHKHEIESGRTSSVGNDILGFDAKGNIVNRPSSHNNNLNWTEICERSSKLISFLDLAGHEKYLKTTIFGMTGYAPNYCLLLVGGNTGGVIGTTKEHLGLSLALKLPLFVVVTKIDSTPANVLESTLEKLQKILKSNGCRKMPILIQNEDDVLLATNNFQSTSKLCPIFQISSVTGAGLDLLKMFLNLLSPHNELNELDKEPAEFQIDDCYSVPVGTVVSGICLKGVIKVNDVLMLGPNKLNKFEPVVIRSIHRKRMPVKEVRSGQSCSFALKRVKRHEVRKGMVLLSPSIEAKAYQEFYAEILILHHPTTIQKNYQAMVHSNTIRQTATIVSMDKETLRTGDKAKVHLKFIKNPEYIKPNQSLVFREGRTKAIGKVLSVIADSTSSSTNNALSNKKMKKYFIHNKKDSHTHHHSHNHENENKE